MFEKLFFWRKKEADLSSMSGLSELDSTAALNTGLPPLGNDPFASSAGMPPVGNSADPFASSSNQMGQPAMQPMSQSAFSTPNNTQQFSPQGYSPTPSSSYGDISPSVASPHYPSSGPVRDSSDAVSPRDIELILSRLDTIRAEVENLSHRFSIIERELKINPRDNWR